MSGENNKWVLKKHPAKRLLSQDETRYWKTNLAKISKAGLEFEFNLPQKTGNCKGDNDTCPCSRLINDTCWMGCVHIEKCRSMYGQEFECPGIMCVGFVSKCIECGEYTIECSGCEHKYDKNRNPESIRKRLTTSLVPSMSYSNITKYGVHSIVKDGSLQGDSGAEIITVGRRIDFWEFFKMAKEIIDQALENGLFIDERCSTHAHLLTTYYGKLGNRRPGIDVDVGHAGPGIPKQINEMERPMPELVLANFHQLCRYYQNAITWMTMGLPDPSKLTRWEKFRVSILDTSPATKPMAKVVDEIASKCVKSKYGWANYVYCQFDDKGDVTRLHVEMRVMDCLLSPSVVASMICLYYAMLIRAVEVSRYGLISLGTAWMEEALAVKEDLMNNTGDWSSSRFSNTSGLSKHYDILIRDSYDLLAQVKHILMKYSPAYDILEQVASKPCALRLCDGDSWQKIEADIAIPMTEYDKVTNKATELVDLHRISSCKNEEEWLIKASRIITDEFPDDADAEERFCIFIENKKRDGEMIFLDKIGTMAFVE